MLKAEFNPEPGDDRLPGMAYGVFSQYLNPVGVPFEFQTGDVRPLFAENHMRGAPDLVFPHQLIAESRKIPRSQRICLGNFLCELTFRGFYGFNPNLNVHYMMKWAKWGYKFCKNHRMVLSPMDFDVIHDVMTGARFLKWCGKKGVTLIIMCGYRFLYRQDEFHHIQVAEKCYPFKNWGNPYDLPYKEVSDAIKASKVFAIIGGGFDDGLNHRVISKARDFGFQGVVTSRWAWENWDGIE